MWTDVALTADCDAFFSFWARHASNNFDRPEIVCVCTPTPSVVSGWMMTLVLDYSSYKFMRDRLAQIKHHLSQEKQQKLALPVA